MNITEEKTVFYSKLVGNFDTPKKLNRSAKSVPSEFIEAVEAGEVKSEMIKQIEKAFPIFTYQSCLTIHGNLPQIERTRIGGYKNVIQNKNGSLEIRWSAIDHQSKKTISHCLRYAEKWNARETSTHGIYFEKTEKAETREEAIEKLKAMNRECENLNIEGLTAKMFVQGYSYFGRFYIILTVLPYSVTADPMEIVEKLTGTPKAFFADKLAEEEAEQIKRQQAATAARQASEAAKAEAEAALLNKRMAQITAEVGKCYIVASVTTTNRPAFRFYRITAKGTFGRVIAETYLSNSTEVEPDKFQPFMKGKQVKIAEITTKQTFAA
jgi:hypothetical protein